MTRPRVSGSEGRVRVTPVTVTASEVRAQLVRALEVDLIGPYKDDEQLDRAPSRFYLTGFLVPREGRGEETIVEPEEDTESEDAEGEDEDAGAEDVRPAGEGSRRRSILPASMGLSVLLPPGKDGEVTVLLRCAEYAPFHADGAKKTTRPSWKRVPHPAYEVRLSLEPGKLVGTHRIPQLTGVSIEATLGVSSSPKPGTRALSVFVVNERAQGERGRKDTQYLFQVSLEVQYAGGFLARPALRRGRHIDDKISSLQYRGVHEYAVGHNVSVETPVADKPTSVRTTWMPRSEVRRVVTSNDLDPDDPSLRVERGMKALTELTTPEAVRTALGALPEAYGRWIERQRAVKIDAADRETVDVLLTRAAEAKLRIAGGIELLREDAGAELYDVRLTCQACGSFKSMGEAQQLAVWYRCKGARPWLGRGPDISEKCEAKPSMKVRTSSSTYFAQIQSALSIPNTSARLERLVRKHLASLSEASHDTLRDTIKFNPPVRSDLGALDLDAVWAMLDSVRRNETPAPPPLRPAEYAYVQDVYRSRTRPGRGPLAARGSGLHARFRWAAAPWARTCERRSAPRPPRRPERRRTSRVSRRSSRTSMGTPWSTRFAPPCSVT